MPFPNEHETRINKNSNYIYKSFPFEIEMPAQDEEGKRIIKGYAAVFNTADSEGDIISPDAFNKSLAKYVVDNRPIILTFQHDQNAIIGKIDTNKFKVDEKGLFVEAEILEGFNESNKASILIKQGVISGFSMFGILEDSTFTKEGERILKQINLLDISIVAHPAHNDARVATVKSMNKHFDLYLDKLEKDDKKVVISILNKYYNVECEDDFQKKCEKCLDTVSYVSTRKDVEMILEKNGIVFVDNDTRKVCEDRLRKAGFSRKASAFLLSKYRTQGHLVNDIDEENARLFIKFSKAIKDCM